MTDAIHINSKSHQTIATDLQADKSVHSPTGAISTAAKASDPASIVALKNTQILQDMKAQIEQLPVVDDAKVESIKQALMQGEYHLNAETIAHKYLEIETLLS